MANPSTRWDFVPVWGVYLNPVTNQPSPGQVTFALSSRVTRVDGRLIYPDGATVTVTIGDTAQQDADIRTAVRTAWRAADQAAAGGSWNAAAWDTWWDTVIVPAAIFTRFPAADDPDIVQTGWTVDVAEALQSAGGKRFAIQPLLSQLALTIPGINLGTIEVPPNSPGVPAPVYAKGVPGGVASLDTAGKVPTAQIPDGVGGASTVDELTDATTVGKAVVQAADAGAARTAIGAASTAQGAKADTAVQPAGLTKAAVGLGSVDNTSDANKPVSSAQQTALDGKAASSHTHTGSQISDSTATGRAVLGAANAAAARTAIGAAPASGISLDATADAADRLAMTAAERAKLAALAGSIYVTTTNATLPALADGTVIARYAATVAGTPVVTAVGTNTSTASSTTIAVTTTAAIPVGDVIVVAFARGTGSTTAGSAAVTLSSGAVDSWASASAQRTGVIEVELLVAKVTTAIPSGATVTITTSTNSTNRAAAAVLGIHNVSTGVPDATSGDAAAGVASTSSAGANTSGTSLTASTDAATTVPNTLVISLFGFNTAATWSYSTSTQDAYVATSAGSSDRGLIIGHKTATATGVQSATVTGTASTGIAGVVVALPISMVDA